MPDERTHDLVLGLDHVQVAVPASDEAVERARQFYGEVLGLPEMPKPAELVARGGAWFRCGAFSLHVGLDPAFQPARKAHPAFLVRDLDALRARLEAAGCAIHTGVQIPGYQRFETSDPAGNRLEFMESVLVETVPGQQRPDAEATDGDAVKARVRDQFGRTAQSYVSSQTHAHGSDLGRLLELAEPRPTDLALDVSTGGGHTALALAPHVGRVIASDLTPTMLAAARRFLSKQGIANADYVIADAERLPFLDASFDLVTVRIAPHHYADIHAACRELARVLRPSGRLVLIDNVAPEDPDLDAFMNDVERRRDPSHVRNYTETEWHRMLAAAGLTVTHGERERKTHDFPDWTARSQMPAAERQALERDMLATPPAVRAYFEIAERDGRVQSWASDFLILRAVRPG